MSEETESTNAAIRERTFIQSVFARRELGVVLAVAGLILVGSLVRVDVFLTLSNIFGILRNAAVVTIIGYGMTLLITAGEFDLSVGSMLGISGGIAAVMILDGYSMGFVLFVVFLFAVLFGIGQGILVTKFGLPSLIVTIGTLTLLRGAHLIILDNVTQSIPAEETPLLLTALGGVLALPFGVFVPFTDTLLFTIPEFTYSLPFVSNGQQTFDRIPLQIFWVAVLGIVFYYILFYTRFGFRSQYTGGNERAARYTGVKTDHIKIANFALVAVLAAFAGIGQLAFTGNVSPLTGDGQELVVIAAVVIGGTNLFGGEGTISGTLLGALVFALTQNILVLAGFGTQLFSVFTGVFIIFAVGVDALTRQTRYVKIWTLYLTPLQTLATGPRSFFDDVEENVQGINAPLTFLGLTTVIWLLLVLFVVLLTFIANPLSGSPFVPIDFSLFIIGSDVAAFGTVPLVAFGVMGIIAFLSSIYIHIFARLLDGSGDIDRTLQIVSYGLAPALLLFVPFLLEGLQFIMPLVVGVMIPLVIAVVTLWFFGVRKLHGLSVRNSAMVIAGTVLLWTLTLFYITSRVGAAG